MDLLSIRESAIKINNTVFRNNRVEHIATVFNSKVDMTECKVMNNYACGNGGLITFHKSSISFSNCYSQNNTAEGLGGVIFIDSSNITITNNVFLNNSVDQNGGAICSVNTYDYSSLSVVNSSFVHNHAGISGAALYATNPGLKHVTSIALHSCTFEGNYAKLDSALYLYDCSNLRTSKSRFSYSSSVVTENNPLIYIVASDRSMGYLTYRTDFSSGKTSLNSSVQDFLTQGISIGFIKFYNRGNPYNITNKETPYAAGALISFA